MVGLSVHGLLGIDTELAQSAVAARQQQQPVYDSVHVRLHQGAGCERSAPAPKPDTRI
jgi:hypothetical protein